MTSPRPIRVAIVGGGCAAMAAAFELSRPEHRGRYQLTVYQQGWRLGGKGASGRGPAGRIEEHGLHIWMGFYENSFRLLRECYAELAASGATPRFAHWRDAFVPDPYIGVAERDGRGAWTSWISYFPPTEGAPGDPVDRSHPLSITGYLRRTVDLLGMLLRDVLVHRVHASDAGDRGMARPAAAATSSEPATLGQRIDRLLAYGRLATLTGIAEATDLLGQVLTGTGDPPPAPVLRLLDRIASATRGAIEDIVGKDDQVRRRWYVIDVMLAAMRGIVTHRLALDPRGFDAINDHDFCDWLRLHGATEATLRSGMIRGALYDLTFAYQDGDPARPAFAAGDALRSALRMFFTYRGSFFWKMRAGMGDVVFAPFYEVLRRRGVDFRFFHRLDNVRLADEVAGQRGHVAALEMSVQAEVATGDYRPLVDIRGLPSWPSEPDHAQLVGGDALRAAGWDPESHWDQHRVGRKTLRVGDDFDLVILGVGLGAIPHVAPELIARAPRWQTMVEKMGTVATQAFQVWMRAEIGELGWTGPSASMTGFVKPFDTWADMPQLIDLEDWRDPPHAVAYFCNTLATPGALPTDPAYPAAERERVREAAVTFLDRHVGHFWPRAVDPRTGFRWELLADAAADAAGGDDGAGTGPDRFRTQFWTANVNPSDRYVQSLPGSSAHRISPLDDSFDNLTICGDWTDCGLNVGCVEGAVMSGRLAAHALSLSPPLDDIVGYDHP
jgi:uncharacterized protein with NAD-binding domain and iron-sulfur cluster